MKVGAPRIRLLAGVFLVMVAAQLIHLCFLMIVQQSDWLERSYRNRWAFRDVPARRGSISDRHGDVLVEDRPAFALLLDYRSFRRRHPVGVAVEGANLLKNATGASDDLFGFTGGRRPPRDAFRTFLEMPLSLLDGAAVSPETARDLRFYLNSLLRSLLVDGARDRALARLREPLLTGTAFDVLGLEDPSAAEALFEDRIALLEELDDELRALGRSKGLWQDVEDRRRGRLWTRELDPDGARRGETAVLLLHRSIPFRVTARISLLRDQHPGLILRPSVERVRHELPPSLDPIMGIVTPYWREDALPGPPSTESTSTAAGKSWIDEKVDDVLGSEGMAEVLGDVSGLFDGAQDRLGHSVRKTVRRHLLNQGRRGRSGVEQAMDDELAGTPGLRWVDRDRHAQEQAQWGDLSVMRGQDLRISIDLRLQWVVEAKLDAAGASGLAMAFIDPRTGDILALGGRPLEINGRRLETSPAATWHGPGDVGSVAKPFVLLEHLDAHRHGRPHSQASSFRPCARDFGTVSGRRKPLSCSSNHGVASLDPVAALGRSCNFFFFTAAQGMGTEGLRSAFHRIGWVAGARTGEGQETYQAKIVGIPAIGKAGLRTQEHVLEMQAIGSGLQASALQVARAYAGLAVGRLPTLGVFRQDRPSHPLGVALADLDTVRDGLESCVQSGTARKIVQLREFGVLGKTGTAEISTKGHNNAWFAGYLTREVPTLAFAAVAYVVEHGRHGSEEAGELLAGVLEQIGADEKLRAEYLPK